jgi:predicted transcriptional regulator of viral defense system
MHQKYSLIKSLAKEKGILRPRDLSEYNIHSEYLTRLCKLGQLEKIGRGLYTLPNLEIDENFSLAQVSKSIPKSTISLLSALRFHNLTTQLPFEVWIAIPNKAHQSSLKEISIRVVRFSGEALSAGIEEHIILGVKVPIYNPAKTIADCFKYRYKIGIDVALEALRECWQNHCCTLDDLWHYSKICRVTNVIKPYLEFLV